MKGFTNHKRFLRIDLSRFEVTSVRNRFLKVDRGRVGYPGFAAALENKSFTVEIFEEIPKWN